MNGHNCDNCNHYLEENEYKDYSSWSYKCAECGFEYTHGTDKTAKEQVQEYLQKEAE